MTSERNTQAVDSRKLTKDEIDFSLKIAKQNRQMDMIGLDIVHAADGKLYLLEVNRSPGFAKFAELTGVNLASTLYHEIK